MLNWPTAIVLCFGMAMITVIITSLIDRNRPLSRHCARCNKLIEQECRTRTLGGDLDE